MSACSGSGVTYGRTIDGLGAPVHGYAQRGGGPRGTTYVWYRGWDLNPPPSDHKAHVRWVAVPRPNHLRGPT